MRQWEIYTFPLSNPEHPHPCVILSPDALLARPRLKLINVVVCQSLRPGDPLDPTDVRLDLMDGLDHATVARCQFVMHVKRNLASAQPVGNVGTERRRAIPRKLIEVFGLLAN